MSEANKAVVRRYVQEILNQGNHALMDELLSADYVFRAANFPDLRGREARNAFDKIHRDAFPDRQFTIDDLLAEGDKMAGRWSLTGTHLGEWAGVAATGKKVSVSGTSIFRVADGMITEEFVEWDALGFMQQVGAVPASTEANKALVRRYFDDLINQDRLALADELFSADSIYHGPNFPELRGREARKEHIASVRRAFPDLRCSVDEVIAEGNKVVVRWLFTGTHQAEMWGVAPTCKEICFRGTSTFQIADGMITDEFMQWDTLGYMQQIGVVPPLAQMSGAGR